jgi:Sugar-transfer associated ATP-grasp
VTPWQWFSVVSNFISEEFNIYIFAKNKKAYHIQLKEIFNLLLAYRYPPYQYIRHGLFKIDAPENYIDFLPPRLIQQFVAKVNPNEYEDMVENKSKFRNILERHGLPCVREIVRRQADGRLFNADGEEISKTAATEIITQYGPKIFVKQNFGNRGVGAMIIDVSAYQDDIFGLPGDILYQQIIHQHPKLEKLFPHSVNTVRIDTLKYNDKYFSNGAVLKMGCNKNHVDNWSAGGIIVGINIKNGRLFKKGKQAAKFGGLEYDAHPDTGETFADFQIPYWQDILDVVRKAAETMAPLVSLGWDVAVTADGPVIVEANGPWDTCLTQEGAGGLAKTKLGEMVIQHIRS